MKITFSSLLLKVAALVILIESAVLAGLGAFYISRFTREIDGRAALQIRLPGTLMNRQLLRYQAVADDVVMAELVGDDFVDGMVFDSGGRVYYALHRAALGGSALEALRRASVPPLARLGRGVVVPVTEQGTRYLVSVTPLTAYEGAKPFFYVYVKVRLAASEVARRRTARLFALGSGACVAATSLGIILAAGLLVTQPIRRLTRSAQRLAEGDLDQDIREERDDEIGKLARSFAVMRDALRRHIRGLEEFNRGLEDAVRRKTEALESNMKRLEQETAERKELVARLHRAQKMEAIGTLAGGVAHDLNNILSAIVSYPELLLADLPEQSPLRRPLQTMQRAGERAAAVVEDLLTLARRGAAASEPVDLNAVVREFVDSPELARIRVHHPEVRLELHLADEALPLSGSPAHLSKCLMNLVLNAAEAISGAGTVSIRTGSRYVDQPLSGYDSVEEGEYVVLTVADTGSGVAPEDLDRIFEPFFTRKALGRSGTGLGLAVVWGVVKDHGGYVLVESTAGRGTSFTLYLPLRRGAGPAAGAVPGADLPRARGESVLVVDDVEEQRAIASAILRRLGYEVSTASAGEEALELLRARPFDALLLDMIMPGGMDGCETYRRALEVRPGLRAVIASGFAETDRVRETQGLGAGPYLKKPYTLEGLATALRRELDRP